MNVELTDILTIIGTLGGFEAIKWGISFYTNRKTNARIEDAHADVEEFKALREYNEFLQKQLSEKEERFIEIQFRKIMKREIRDIEKDIENIS